MRVVSLALPTAALLGLACAIPGGLRAPPGKPWTDWQSAHGRDHPLVGRIWESRSGAFAAPRDVLARAAASRFVLLGEKHDNADHHRLQAWLIEGFAAAGRHRAVALEMIPSDRSDALAEYRELNPEDVDGIADAVGWRGSGWPEWALYRPVFAAAIGGGLEIEAADVPRVRLAALRAGGLATLGADETARLALSPGLTRAAHEALAAEIREAHCGFAPEEFIDAMIGVQRARDAHLADALVRGTGDQGAILIAGTGHVRRDRGVPLYLRRRVPDAPVLIVALVEVSDGQDDPAAYLEAEQGEDAATAFDFVWFTPRADDADPCEALRERMSRRSTRAGATSRP